jgi:hypothetical protein
MRIFSPKVKALSLLIPPQVMRPQRIVKEHKKEEVAVLLEATNNLSGIVPRAIC